MPETDAPPSAPASGEGVRAPAPSRSRRLLALALAVAAAAALAYAAIAHGTGSGPLDAMPADSFLVASVDVARLRASPLSTVIFDKDRAWGLGDLAQACGFDPLARIDELDVAIPEGNDVGDFGIAARAKVTRDELVRCAENVAGAHGETRKVEEVGAFHFVTDDKGHALAVRDTGPILVGRAPFVRAMIDAADHRAPNVRASREHMELRDAIAPAGSAPMVVVTALLPKTLRDRLKREMGAELGILGSNVSMAGILGVSGAGLSLRETDEGMLEIKAALRCDTGGACEEVRKFALAKRLSFSQDLTLRLLGLGPIIDAFDASADGPTLTATTRARSADISSAIDRAQKLKNRFNGDDRDKSRPSPSPGSAAGLPQAPPPSPAGSSGGPLPGASGSRFSAPFSLVPDEIMAAKDGGLGDSSPRP